MLSSVDNYLISDVHTPFFLVVGDVNYTDVKNALIAKSLSPVNVSKFCAHKDKRPDLDSLSDELVTIDTNQTARKIVLLGLGEYLALCGEQTVNRQLSKLKDFNLGPTKVVLLLRGVSLPVRKLQEEDRSRFDNRRVCFLDNGEFDITITFVPDNLELAAHQGVWSVIIKVQSQTTRK